MNIGNSDAIILPVPPEPFALIIGPAMHAASDAAVEEAIRHMGLRPERVQIADPDILAQISEPRFRLRFGSLNVVAGQASCRALDMIDPLHPSTSLLAASLPPDWREGGQCWMFIPERGEPSQSVVEPRAGMGELFNMIVLLIDLFDASHFFWSPARLWSDAPQLRASTAEMLVSGMPPVLHMVAFRHRDAEDARVGTRGLALFGEQELEARIPAGWTMAEMVKRLARLALDMTLNGPIRNIQRIRGLEPGEWVTLMPPAESEGRTATVLVEFGSDT